MGAVFSHTKGYTTLPGLLPPLAFHAIFTALGLFCLTRSKPKTAENEARNARD